VLRFEYLLFKVKLNAWIFVDSPNELFSEFCRTGVRKNAVRPSVYKSRIDGDGRPTMKAKCNHMKQRLDSFAHRHCKRVTFQHHKKVTHANGIPIIV